MKLTNAERKAIEDSISHWIRDIRDPLVKTMGSLRYNTSDCPLCQLVKDECNICPHVKVYGISCSDDDSAWKRFANHPNLTTCDGMIKALKRILKVAEIGREIAKGA